ncbi:MAG: GNAT family N-acetyltransferase, partial [Flammeovirgaceae bacterium]
MNFVSLEKLPFSVIHQAFLYAFSDYAVKMEMSEQELMNRLTRIAYKPKLSGGVLVDQTLCAFILTGLGQFQGKLTAYNGGTGVIPTHRRQQLGTKVYQALLELYRAQDVEQCLLEVITDNDKAVKLYKSLGFRVSRVFKCYALNEKLEKETVDVPLQISQAESIDLTKYVPFCTTQPSWQNMMEAVLRDLNQEIILEAYSKTTLVGFISFNPVNGKLSQLAVAP